MLKNLAHDLVRSDTRYCLLHGWQSLPEYLPSDLDLIVHPEDLSTLEGILRHDPESRIIQLIEYQASSFFFVLAILKGEKIRFMQIDTVPDYRRDGRVFFTAEELLAGHRQWQGFSVASPGVEFAYLLVKKVLKGFMPDHQKQRLGKLCQELGHEGFIIGRRLFGQRLGDGAISWIDTGDWHAFEQHLRRLRRAVLWQVTRRDPLNPLRSWIAEWRRIWRRQRYPTGLSVAVLGPDGAGKTTLIQHLRDNLTGAFRQIEVFHLRPGILGAQGTHGPVTDPHGKPPFPWWLSLLKIPYYLLDYSLGYLFKVRPRLVRSTLVLFDRYYDDLLVDPRRYRYGGPRGLARLARQFTPRPDLFLIVDVREEMLLRRKQEVSPAEVRRQREAYRKLALRVPNAVLLDGSLAPADVARNASEALLDYLHERYLKRRHLWFHDDGLETLRWLESVLFPSEKPRAAPSIPANDGPQTQQRANGSFGWLSCKDGRGYLIPLSSRQVGLNALQLYNAQNPKARAVKKLLMIGLKHGFAQPFLRKVQLRPSWDTSQGGTAGGLLLEHLQQLLGREDLQFAISLGIPGQHRKPVLQALAPDGTVIGYVKVGWNDATNALVQTEADVLQRFRDAAFQAFTVPTVLYAGQWEGRVLCIQSSPVSGGETAPKVLTPRYLAAQREMAAMHMRWMPLSRSAFWAALWQRIERTQSTYYRQLLHQGARMVEAWLGERPLPFHLSHGDFTPWNARLLREHLYLFDWEYAAWEAPPGYDLFHFTVQTAGLLRKRSPWRTWESIQRGEKAERWIAEHLKSLDASQVEVEPLVLLYTLERLAFYAAERGADGGTLRYFANLAHHIIAQGKARQ